MPQHLTVLFGIGRIHHENLVDHLDHRLCITGSHQRIADRIRQDLSELLIRKVSDPRLHQIFVTDVKVLDPVTKQSLRSARSSGEGPASILKTQIDEISRDIRRGRGLEALKIEKAPPKIVDVTTASSRSKTNQR